MDTSDGNIGMAKPPRDLIQEMVSALDRRFGDRALEVAEQQLADAAGAAAATWKEISDRLRLLRNS